MKYFKPFTYVVGKKPGGWTNLLLITVCVLIPIVGAIVLLGYRAEVAEDLNKDPDQESYPDFKFDRFGDYLQRGLWPFVVQLIVSLAFGGLMMVPFALAGLIAYSTKEPMYIFLGYLLLPPIIVAMMMVLMPMELHAQLTNRFAFGQEFRFMVRFLGKVWGQALMATLAWWFFGGLLTMCGYALLCIGIYPAMAILTMAQQHYAAQLYRLYLEEGGEPIDGPSDRMELEDA